MRAKKLECLRKGWQGTTLIIEHKSGLHFCEYLGEKKLSGIPPKVQKLP